jgi:hypothetical protein
LSKFVLRVGGTSRNSRLSAHWDYPPKLAKPAGHLGVLPNDSACTAYALWDNRMRTAGTRACELAGKSVFRHGASLTKELSRVTTGARPMPAG